MKRFNVGQFMRETKAKKARLIIKTEKMKELDEELRTVEESLQKKKDDLEAKRKEVEAKQEQLNQLDLKVGKIVQEVEELGSIEKELNRSGVRGQKRKEYYRRNPPDKISDRVARKRRRETMQVAMKIHGGTVEAAEEGLVDTVVKKCRPSHAVEKICSNRAFMNEINRRRKRKIREYEKSDKNKIRSVAVYYSGGVMGKRKYRRVYRELSYKTNDSGKQNIALSVDGCSPPKLFPYHRLMPYIKQIPIGQVYNVHETLCDGMEEKVHGCYRDLEETLLTLAQYYLDNDKLYDLKWFDNKHYKFYVSLGGDGAPCGKDDTACAWLVGVLNIGRAVLSSSENYLLFGANCSEDSQPVQTYLKRLCKEIADVEKKEYSLNHNNKAVKATFTIAELPNDMKMLAFISGELSNSAKYFSSFADVTKENGPVLNGTFGKDPKNTWRPWVYTERLKVVKKVEEMKQKLSKVKLANSTKRNRITALIAKCESRQEFVPPLGQLIDRIHVEPLHLKNNLCALLHQHLLDIIFKLSNLGDSVLFSQLSSKSVLAQYIKTMRIDCNLSRLSKKIIKWFDDTKSQQKKFDYRFTGKDSRMFVHNFMFLVASVEKSARRDLERDPKAMQHLHALAYLCLLLRDCIALFSRVELSSEEVSKLQDLCYTFFRLHLLVFGFHPSVWTLGFIVPAHTKDMINKYQMSLGINSMEGREAKHISISRYAGNTNFQSRWQQIFMHEHISLLWLRGQGHNLNPKAKISGKSYVPKRCKKADCCYCGYYKEDPGDSKCKFCSHRQRALLIKSDKQGKLLKVK